MLSERIVCVRWGNETLKTGTGQKEIGYEKRVALAKKRKKQKTEEKRIIGGCCRSYRSAVGAVTAASVLLVFRLLACLLSKTDEWIMVMSSFEHRRRETMVFFRSLLSLLYIYNSFCRIWTCTSCTMRIGSLRFFFSSVNFLYIYNL